MHAVQNAWSQKDKWIDPDTKKKQKQKLITIKTMDYFLNK